MRNVLAAAVAVLLCGVASASAQVLSLEFHDGRVKLIAENVPVGRILAEWTRLGGTKIVHGERIPGAPVTLQLIDIPEAQALGVVLRGAAGYMVAARETGSTGASVFDRILVLPTTVRAPSAASLPPPAAQQAPQFDEPFQPDDGPEPDLPGPPAGAPSNRIPPRGRVQTGLIPQQGAAQPQPVPEPEASPDAGTSQTGPTSSNPFGTMPGSARPGVISAPPRNPNGTPQPVR
jgi:hypothetical protein